MPGMSKIPTVKVARRFYDIKTADERDLSFSSDWKTPKIYRQTESSQFNIVSQIGYIPKFMGFRGLSSETPAVDPWSSYIAGGYSVGDFTHCNLSLVNYEGGGAIIASNGFVDNQKFSGTTVGESWSDDSSWMIFFLEKLDGQVPDRPQVISGPVFIVGSGTKDIRQEHPSENIINSNYDTLKIFKTGTLTLNVPEDTTVSTPKLYSSSVTHDLGYAPVYLPEASVGWRPGFIPDDFVVNDYLGFPQGDIGSEASLDVYVDSEKLYLQYRRFSPGNARTITMYYTIFYNRIDEEFNLL